RPRVTPDSVNGSLHDLECAAHEGMDAAVVGHDLTRLEPALGGDGQGPGQPLAGGPDRGRADSELRGVELVRPAGARGAVGDREGRSNRAQAWEPAGCDRVVDPHALEVREGEV